MKKYVIKIQYNSPVVLTFALVSFAVLLAGWFFGDDFVTKYFAVYRASLKDPFTYLRFFTHVLGHADYSHYIGNMLLILVVGPPLEEKYGSLNLLLAVALTALISGIVQFIFFPGTALLGASGIVFMMIVMSSLAGMKSHCIPLTLIFVVVFYLGGEIMDGLFVSDNVSQLTHIIGGVCGAVIGYILYGK